MPTYAVTGASGHLGRLAVQELLARGVPASDVVAVVRTRGKAADLAAATHAACPDPLSLREEVLYERHGRLRVLLH